MMKRIRKQREELSELIEAAKQEILIGLLEKIGADEVFLNFIRTFLRCGCPVEVLVKAIGEIAEQQAAKENIDWGELFRREMTEGDEDE